MWTAVDGVSGSPLWRPDPARAEATHLARFLHHVGQPGYPELHRWSVEQPSEFWAAVWDQCGVVGRRGVEVVVPDHDMPATRFFPDAHLNVAENLLAGWAGDEPAIISHDETGHREECSGSELVRDVAALAAALEELGVGPGDRVAAWLPNRPEAVITMLAAASLGAVFSSCSPDFGTLGVLDRFGQIEPVVLVAAAGYHYNGSRHRLPAAAGRDPRRPPQRPDDRRRPGPLGIARRRVHPGRATGRHRRVGRPARPLPRPGRACASERSPSTIPGTSSTRRARPERRSASSTAPAACC